MLDRWPGLCSLSGMTKDNNDHPLLDSLIALETGVWQALIVGDKAADIAALAPSFLGVYPSGFSDRAGHASQLDDGPSVAEFELSQGRVQVYTADLAMLSYRAEFRRVGSESGEAMFVSSLWQRGPEGWRNLFSQDTPEAS